MIIGVQCSAHFLMNMISEHNSYLKIEIAAQKGCQRKNKFHFYIMLEVQIPLYEKVLIMVLENDRKVANILKKDMKEQFSCHLKMLTS